MEKRKLMAVAAATVATLLVPEIGNAQRCCFRLFNRNCATRTRAFIQTNAEYCPGVPGWRTTAQPCAPVSGCTGGACSLDVSTPSPCASVSGCTGGACSIEVDAPEPCAPVSTGCTGGACSLDVSTPSPCASVSGCTVASYSIGELLDVVNEARAGYKLPPLTNDESLRVQAKERVKICAYFGQLRHGSGNEVLAFNYGGGIRTAVNQWLNSPRHREMILNAGYRYAGVAVMKDASGRAWCAVRFR